MASELINDLPRALYVAAGGDLPAMERHYRFFQGSYRKAAGAALRTLAEHARRGHTVEGETHAEELEEIAKQVEEARE